MWSRRILIVFIGLLAGLFDATVAPWFGGPFGAIRVALPLIIVLSAFSTLGRSLTAAVAAGLVLDVFLPSFSLMTLRLLIIAGVIRAASQTYLTNRSLIGSLALGAIGLALDRVMLLAVTGLRGLSSAPFIREAPVSLLSGVVWMIIVMTGVFLLFAAFTRRFMPPVSRR